MKTRTPIEIKRQLEGLEAMKVKIPLRNKFGENNHAPIDAQIKVISGLKKPDHYYADETAEEYEDGDNDIYHAADKAQRWLNGTDKGDLFE